MHTIFSSAFPVGFKNITGILHILKLKLSLTIAFLLIFLFSLSYNLVLEGFLSVPKFVIEYLIPIPVMIPFKFISKFNILLLFFISLPVIYISDPLLNFFFKV